MGDLQSYVPFLASMAFLFIFAFVIAYTLLVVVKPYRRDHMALRVITSSVIYLVVVGLMAVWLYIMLFLFSMFFVGIHESR